MILLLLPFCCQIQAQGIVTGDTMSQGVVYRDIDDLMISASFPSGYDSKTIDINEDGVDDLKFTASATATMGSTLESTMIVALANTETVFYPPHSTWVDELSGGVTIDEGSPWAPGGTLKSQASFPDTMYSSGIFNYGYAGFRIPQSGGYLYGWVHLSAGNSHIFVHEYAYQSMNTSMHELNEEFSLRIYPNPAMDFINLCLPSNHDYHSITIIDATGSSCFHGLLNQHQKQMKINISSLRDGLYTLVIHGKRIINRKVLKVSG